MFFSQTGISNFFLILLFSLLVPSLSTAGEESSRCENIPAGSSALCDFEYVKSLRIVDWYDVSSPAVKGALGVGSMILIPLLPEIVAPSTVLVPLSTAVGVWLIVDGTIQYAVGLKGSPTLSLVRATYDHTFAVKKAHAETLLDFYRGRGFVEFFSLEPKYQIEFLKDPVLSRRILKMRLELERLKQIT